MKLVGVIAYLVFLLAACADPVKTEVVTQEINQNPISMKTLKVAADSVILNQAKGLVFYEGQPFSGTAVSYYANGTIAESKDYNLGKKDGYFQKYFEDGKKSFQSYYKLGRLEGKGYSWWKNGNLRSESQYENGQAEGLQVQWYKSGAKFKELQMVAGREQGMQRSWRENGKIYNNYEAKNGRIFGLKRAALCYELDDEVVQYKN